MVVKSIRPSPGNPSKFMTSYIEVFLSNTPALFTFRVVALTVYFTAVFCSVTLSSDKSPLITLCEMSLPTKVPSWLSVWYIGLWFLSDQLCSISWPLLIPCDLRINEMWLFHPSFPILGLCLKCDRDLKIFDQQKNAVFLISFETLLL